MEYANLHTMSQGKYIITVAHTAINLHAKAFVWGANNSFEEIKKQIQNQLEDELTQHISKTNADLFQEKMHWELMSKYCNISAFRQDDFNSISWFTLLSFLYVIPYDYKTNVNVAVTLVLLIKLKTVLLCGVKNLNFEFHFGRRSKQK